MYCENMKSSQDGAIGIRRLYKGTSNIDTIQRHKNNTKFNFYSKIWQ